MYLRVSKNIDGVSYDTKVIPFYKGTSNLELSENEMQVFEFGLRNGEITGKHGEIRMFCIPEDKDVKNVVFLGLGEKEELCLEIIRRSFSKVIRECKEVRSRDISIIPVDLKEEISFNMYGRAVVEGMMLADYTYDCFKSEKKESTINEVTILCHEKNIDDLTKGLEEGRILAKATVFARNLVNEPANHLTPEELGQRVKEEGEKSGFEVEVFDEYRIAEIGMKAFMEVGKGSINPPRLIVMKYFGNKEDMNNVTGLVGKGLTYDSGGYSLKPAAGMGNMKGDMGGAASVIGAISAIAGMRLKVNVVGVVAACENMLSGGSYKNGDVIGSMAGKTIEVVNTDAEGRLTLADAVYYAVEVLGVKRIVDIATLTGAVVTTLGIVATGVLSNDDVFFGNLLKACEVTGERIWRLPNFPEYKELLKSDIADLKNSSGKYAGTIAAGLFIGEFVQNKPWIHMDIAGTSGSEKDFDYISKGGTGVGVRTLYQLIKQS